MFDNLLVTRQGAVALVTINRPKVLNALDSRTLEQLHALAGDLAADAGVRAVIITGAGDRAFVAGADIRELERFTPSEAGDYARRGQETFDRIERMGKPVIAAINGFALGGGCELAMACTLRLAAETAQFAMPEVNLGLLPGFAGTQRLPRLVGRAKALDLLLTGRQITAEAALEIGLVSRVVPDASLLAETTALAEALAAKAPVAVRSIIDVVYRGSDLPLADGERLEAESFAAITATADMREGVSAFLARRKPVFRGE
jgi:enoyl-CoA hydratase